MNNKTFNCNEKLIGSKSLYRGSLVRAFFGSQENAHEPNNAPVKYIDILYIMVDLAHADSFTSARVAYIATSHYLSVPKCISHRKSIYN